MALMPLYKLHPALLMLSFLAPWRPLSVSNILLQLPAAGFDDQGILVKARGITPSDWLLHHAAAALFGSIDASCLA